MPRGRDDLRIALAVSLARQLGLNRLAIPTAGNAGGALAAYGARAGMEVYVFMPEDTPRINQMEAAAKKLARQDAAQATVDIIEELARD